VLGRDPTCKFNAINAVDSVRGLLACFFGMRVRRSVLVVDSDAEYGQALATLLRRDGVRVRLARTREQALQAARRVRFDLAVVDLLLGGGGVELARALSRRVPRLLLSLGAAMAQDEILEAALGFPVRRKVALPSLLGLAGVVPAKRRSSALVGTE
jgi:CheY-like chemotaxis protein